MMERSPGISASRRIARFRVRRGDLGVLYAHNQLSIRSRDGDISRNIRRHMRAFHRMIRQALQRPVIPFD
jgi:hypothetical protein